MCTVIEKRVKSEKINIAINLIKLRTLSDEQIAQATGLSLKMVVELAEQMKMESRHNNHVMKYIFYLYEGKIEEAQKSKHDVIPDKLYKFEPYEEYRLKTIENSKIYLSCPTAFNDAFDTKGIYYSDKFLKKIYSENDIKMDFEQFSEKIEEILNNFYKYSGITCFSENLYNFPMWGNYAGNRTGFCMEYRIKSDSIDDCFFDRFYPVIYSDKKFNFEKILEVIIPKAFNGQNIPNSVILLLYSLVGSIKHISWAYEKEWRYIIPSKFKEQEFPFKVNAIYLGDKFKEENYIRMKKMAINLNCELYKMTSPRHFDRDFRFIPQKIELN